MMSDVSGDSKSTVNEEIDIKNFEDVKFNDFSSLIKSTDNIVFDMERFPDVKVDLREISSDEDYETFTMNWLNLYKMRCPFSFFIDTENLSRFDVRYAIRLTSFILKIKKQKNQLLQKSIIKVYYPSLLYIFKFMFKICKPVAPVHVILLKNKSQSKAPSYFGLSDFFERMIIKPVEYKTYTFWP